MATPGRLTDYCTSGGCAAKLPAGRIDALLARVTDPVYAPPRVTDPAGTRP